MVKYPLSYNPILEYWGKIETRDIVVCDKIRRTYKKLVADVETLGDEYFYSPKRANHILEFAENYCHLIQGSTAPVVLELWEKGPIIRNMSFTFCAIYCTLSQQMLGIIVFYNSFIIRT